MEPAKHPGLRGFEPGEDACGEISASQSQKPLTYELLEENKINHQRTLTVRAAPQRDRKSVV